MKLSRSLPLGETLTQDVIQLLKWVGISPEDIKDADTIETWEGSQVIEAKVIAKGIVKITKRLEY